MNTYFPGISKVAYEGPKSTNPLAFRYYNPEEVVAGKTMREQLKFALSYWHTLCGDGTDMFGRGTFVKDFGESDPMAVYRAKAYAAFELMDKLDIDYFCFHDRDIAPEAATLKETNARLDEITDLTDKVNNTIDDKAAKRCCGVRPTASTIRGTCTGRAPRPTPTCSLSRRRRSRRRWKSPPAWAARDTCSGAAARGMRPC